MHKYNTEWGSERILGLGHDTDTKWEKKIGVVFPEKEKMYFINEAGFNAQMM